MQYIYYASVKSLFHDAEWMEKCIELDEQRRTKVLRCRHSEDRARTLGAGLLLMRACEQHGWSSSEIALLPIDPKAAKSAFRKTCTEEIYGNISHAGELVAVVLSDQPTGVDIEPCSRMAQRSAHADALAQRILDEGEKEQYRALRQMNAPEAWNFLSFVWTRKEAYAKSCSVGLGMDFAQIHTGEDPRYRTEKIPQSDDREAYWLSVYPAQETCVIRELKL